ncbi:hypothetical protein CAEBREN_22408 [Caenorhabditis brenneri]|uniref:MADF domain-containing protein n=1 Tax=Caenorhabditis brenneri TaxID=135651 RepID=G0NYY2_CAEBE|nr:hypothetical protein CAEBREN_22408 [Caenorhabditis brenneri]
MVEIRVGSPNLDPLEDDFLLALIDSVQRNPCVYNRYDPLHKMTDYKHGVWQNISLEIGYDGQPVELERKWKHMRDKYVRLRKQDKQKAPIKDTNKWYNYYQKMSFLDPYVEHRNRKRQKDFMDGGNSLDMIDEDALFLEDLDLKGILRQDSLAGLGYESPLTSSSTSSSSTVTSYSLESPVEETEEQKKNLLLLYDKLFVKAVKAEKMNGNNAPLLAPVPSDVKTTTSSSEPRSRKRKPIPVQIRQESPLPEKIIKEEQVDDPAKDDQVNLFIRSISETMSRLDRKKFAMAQIEISKVLYDIEFGKNRFSNKSTL